MIEHGKHFIDRLSILNNRSVFRNQSFDELIIKFDDLKRISKHFLRNIPNEA
jgi:hypothetical protein